MRTKMTFEEKRHSFKTRSKEKRPDYKVVKYGEERSTILHTCGKRFEATNDAFIRGIAKCPCLHLKPLKLTLDYLKQLFKQADSNWLATKYTEGSDIATFKHKECKHVHDLSISNLSHVKQCRCPTCYPNKFAPRYLTHDQYVAKLAKERPNYKLLGKYVNSTTRTKYKHKTCGTVFEMQPSWFQRLTTVCPNCKER